MNLKNLLIYCLNPDCGEPIPRNHRYAKRPMIFAGYHFVGNVAYMCPECARKRYFKQSFFGEVEETAGDCFVACTVYGSADAPQVNTLRQFRDKHLVHHWLGRIFVKGYYSVFGPSAAKLVGLTGAGGRRAFRWLLDRLVVVLKRRLKL